MKRPCLRPPRSWVILGPVRRLLVAVFVVAAACGGGAGDDAPAGVPRILQPPAGRDCSPVESIPIEGQDHIADGATVVYRSRPPTSGTHWQTPAAVGIYDEELPDAQLVHNLEHGHVVIRHRGLTGAQGATILAVVQADPASVVVSPKSDLEWRLALTSWGRAQVCTEVPDDLEGIVRSFVGENRNHAPETIP